MARTQQSFAIEIRKKVFDSYLNNKDICDKAYDEANNNDIKNLYIVNKNETDINSLLSKVSIVILTANKYERNILHKKIYESTRQKIIQFDIELLTSCNQFNSIYGYYFKWGNNSILHIHANVKGSYTIGGSADIIRWVRSNDYLFPKRIISFGLCFGTDSDNYDIGDVIISDKIYPYFIGVKVKYDRYSDDDLITVVDDNAFRIDSNLYKSLNNLKNNNEFNDLPFSVDLKSFITGEAVINSQNARSKINEITTQDTPVGEMEGYGVFKECGCSDYKIPCVVIKSICDWGVEKNFEANDTKTLQSFIERYEKIINKTIDNEAAKYMIVSLKDRLQAYAANCTFTVLDRIIKSIDCDISLFSELVKWLANYRGATVDYKEIVNKAKSLTVNINCKSLNTFINEFILTLVRENNSFSVEYKSNSNITEISYLIIKQK